MKSLKYFLPLIVIALGVYWIYRFQIKREPNVSFEIIPAENSWSGDSLLTLGAVLKNKSIDKKDVTCHWYTSGLPVQQESIDCNLLLISADSSGRLDARLCMYYGNVETCHSKSIRVKVPVKRKAPKIKVTKSKPAPPKKKNQRKISRPAPTKTKEKTTAQTRTKPQMKSNLFAEETPVAPPDTTTAPIEKTSPLTDKLPQEVPEFSISHPLYPWGGEADYVLKADIKDEDLPKNVHPSCDWTLTGAEVASTASNCELTLNHLIHSPASGVLTARLCLSYGSGKASCQKIDLIEFKEKDDPDKPPVTKDTAMEILNAMQSEKKKKAVEITDDYIIWHRDARIRIVTTNGRLLLDTHGSRGKKINLTGKIRKALDQNAWVNVN